jgi:CheY-like chemotaxis protein
MPDSDGFEVLKTLKQNSRLKTIPVVMYTSSSLKEDVQKAYDNGANAYLVKPYGFKALKDQLSEVSSYWFDIVRLHGPTHKVHDTDTWYDDLN